MECEVCRAKQKQMVRPKTTAEVTTSAIKEDRKIYATDIVQPFRDKHLAKEYVDAYPENVKKMVQEGHVSQEEVKNAKNIWGESEYYKRE